MLSGPEIRNRIKAGEIVIDPFDESAIGPNSVNLRLGDKLKVYDSLILDPAIDIPTEEITIPPGGYVLHPGQGYLGVTMEYTETHGFVPRVDGRSSIGRLFLLVHATAGFGDDGFCGCFTLELVPLVRPVTVYPQMKICQISYTPVIGERQPYAGKYNGAREAQACRLWKEFSR